MVLDVKSMVYQCYAWTPGNLVCCLLHGAATILLPCHAMGMSLCRLPSLLGKEIGQMSTSLESTHDVSLHMKYTTAPSKLKAKWWLSSRGAPREVRIQ